MQTLIISIWIIQGILMFVDEFYFHHKRRLKKWERIGHPVDTLFFALCFLFVLFNPFDNQSIFFILAIFSSLIITKDEWVHSKECEPMEQWLHAVLFVIHPISIGALYFAWKQNLYNIIIIQSIIITLFGMYQTFYWNFFTKRIGQS